jgi:hypothetical protein
VRAGRLQRLLSWGEVTPGTGKTHLLIALGTIAAEQDTGSATSPWIRRGPNCCSKSSPPDRRDGRHRLDSGGGQLRGNGLRAGVQATLGQLLAEPDDLAKGPKLLGVRAVLAESFERIHRSNLIGMGILPLQFLPGETAESLGLTGEERIVSHGIPAVVDDPTRPHVDVHADARSFSMVARLDTRREADRPGTVVIAGDDNQRGSVGVVGQGGLVDPLDVTAGVKAAGPPLAGRGIVLE